jgi:hypothetical protein
MYAKFKDVNRSKIHHGKVQRRFTHVTYMGKKAALISKHKNHLLVISAAIYMVVNNKC